MLKNSYPFKGIVGAEFASDSKESAVYRCTAVEVQHECCRGVGKEGR